jgi:hypothetical protein
VHIGPVSLEQYLEHATTEMRAHRDTLYALTLPSAMIRPVDERWSVAPPARGCVIGDSSAPLHLGINSRLSAAMTPTSQGPAE